MRERGCCLRWLAAAAAGNPCDSSSNVVSVQCGAAATVDLFFLPSFLFFRFVHSFSLFSFCFLFFFFPLCSVSSVLFPFSAFFVFSSSLWSLLSSSSLPYSPLFFFFNSTSLFCSVFLFFLLLCFVSVSPLLLLVAAVVGS